MVAKDSKNTTDDKRVYGSGPNKERGTAVRREVKGRKEREGGEMERNVGVFKL